MKRPWANKAFRDGCIGIAALLVLVTVGAVAANVFIPTHPPYTAAAPVVKPQACSPNASVLLNEINAERSKLNAPALTVDGTLVKAAQDKLNDMVANQYYGHLLIDGSSPYQFERNLGVHAALSEDIDVNALTPEIDWNAFKNSSGHYQSLTDAQYTRIGVVEQCTDYKVLRSTGPDDNSSLVGKQAKELTVIELAGPEPTPRVIHEQSSCPVTTCADGSCSYSTGSGTCSSHSGEAY